MTKTLLMVACSAFILSACSSSSSSDQTSLDVTIPFAAEANGVAIDCDTQLTGLGTNNSNANVTDFRFYLHDVRLIDIDGLEYPLTLTGNAWQQENLALLDFTNKESACSGATKESNTEIQGTIYASPSVQFTGVAFMLGVPSNLNHEDTVAAASPLNITSLHWNWQNGYKYMRLDVAPLGGVNAGASTTWNFHLGSTNCSGDPQLNETVSCGRPNRAEITLSNFDPSANTILLDYGALLASSDITADAGGAAGCMSGATDPECADIFEHLGMDVVTGSMDGSLSQSVFSVQ